MEDLTGLTGFDWALVLLYAAALALAVGAWVWRANGTRILGALAVPLILGTAGVAYLVALYWAETEHAARRAEPVALGGILAALFVGITIADFLVSRIAPTAAAAPIPGSEDRRADLALSASLLIPAALALAGIAQLDSRTTSGFERSRLEGEARRTILADFELPGQPLGVAFRSPSEAYVSLGTGELVRLDVTEEGDVDGLTTVATGLRHPRGIAISGRALFVAELGRLPCNDPFRCKGENVEGASSTKDGERSILRTSRARLLRFNIDSNGGLSGPRVILDELPVANTDHAVNSVTVGPNGRLYLSIGHLDRLYASNLTASERARPHFGLLGTVVSLKPDGSDLEVVARGLRNVYELAFDVDGRLYGVDNDGPTRGAWRREEVLQIKHGEDYGYPVDGTYGPYTGRTEPPLWVLDTVGSGGIEWLGPREDARVVVGSCGDVYTVHLALRSGTVVPSTRQPVEHLLRVPGCVTSVERARDTWLALALVTFSGPPRLLIVDVG